MSEIRETLIQLRYARQEIEHIEGELKKGSVSPVASHELRVKIDGVIDALYNAKARLLEEAKP